MNPLLQACRLPRHSPGYTAAAVVTLALALGACAALLSAWRTLVLQPLRYPAAKELAQLWTNDSARQFVAPSISWPKFKSFAADSRVFASAGAHVAASFALTGEGDPAVLTGLRVNRGFLATLGVAPELGRNFLAAEDSPGGADVVLLSRAVFRGRFGGDERIVGSSITLNGAPHTVIGVLPPLEAPFANIQVVAPRAFEPGFPAADQVRNGASYLSAFARLKPGVTHEAASVEVAELGRRYAQAHPTHGDANNPNESRPYARELGRPQEPAFRVLLAAGGAALLIAVANTACLALVRRAARRRDHAVRLSLGGTRAQLAREALAEALLLSFAAGGFGLLGAQWGLSGLQQLAGDIVPPGVALGLNPFAVGATLALALAAGLVVGVVTAWPGSQRDLAARLRESSRDPAGGRSGARIRAGLIVAEITLGSALLIGAGLLLLSFARLSRVNPGVAPRGAAAAFFALPATRYDTPEKQAAFYSRVVAELRRQPGVTAAGAAFGLPFYTPTNVLSTYVLFGQPIPPLADRALADYTAIGEGYFAAAGTPLLEGRGILETDTLAAPRVCVVSAGLAKRRFPGESAVGRHILAGRKADVKYEIVGVVGDTHAQGLHVPPPDRVYYSLAQRGALNGSVVARTDGDPAALRAAFKAAVAAVDPSQPVSSFDLLEDLVAISLGRQRLVVWLAGVFAGLALLLAAVGLYGVLAYTVARRTAEIGVRLALGADRAGIMRLVLGQGLRLVGLGLVLGVAAAWAGAHLLQSQLYGVQPREPLVFVLVPAIFAGVGLAACALPAWRATRVDPLIALRTE